MNLLQTALEILRASLKDVLPFVLEALIGATIIYGFAHGGKRAAAAAKWDLLLVLLAAMGAGWIWAGLTPTWVGWALALGAPGILTLPALLGLGSTLRDRTPRLRGEND